VRGDKTALVKMLLHGLSGPITVAGREYGRKNPIPMPPSGLEDQQIADVLTFVRAEFGDNASPITAEEVTAVRRAHGDRSTSWTADELSR
jgi:mono/diheme cytochrome c family protein